MPNQKNDPNQQDQKEKLSGISNLFERTWETYKKLFSVLAGIMAVSVIIGIVLAIVIAFLVAKDATIPLHALAYAENIEVLYEMLSGLSLLSIVLMILLIIVGVLVNTWIYLSLYYAIWKREENIDIKTALKNGFEKILSGFWINILVGLAILGGLVLFIIPSIIFAIWFAFSLYILVAENKKGTSALKRSRFLVQGRWLPVAGRLFLITLIGGIASFVLETIPLFGGLISTILIPPFAAIFIFFVYEELKNKKGEVASAF